MMQDLYKYGPLAVALEPGMDFMYYRSGVYKSSPIKTKQMWVKVDHAVLLIGWGEDGRRGLRHISLFLLDSRMLMMNAIANKYVDHPPRPSLFSHD